MTLLGLAAAQPPWWPVPTFAGLPPAQYTPNFVPTPVDNGNAVIHPSVVDMVAATGKPMAGFRWILADTPFPPDGTENPCIWGSNDRINWTVPAGLTNPIYPWQGAGYNSDTELVWDPAAKQLVVFWRDYNSTAKGIRILAATSPDAVHWTVLPDEVLLPTGPQFSPTVAQHPDGTWRMWLYGQGVPPRMYAAPTPLGPWAAAGDVSFTWLGADHGTLNWHGDMIWHRGMWIGAFSLGPAAKEDCLVVSADGLAWRAMDTTRISGYRPTLQRSTEPGHIDVWVGQREAYAKYGPRNIYWRVPETDWLALAAKAGITPGP